MKKEAKKLAIKSEDVEAIIDQINNIHRNRPYNERYVTIPEAYKLAALNTIALELKKLRVLTE